MAVSTRPQDFAFGREAPDGSAWRLFGEEVESNPKFDVEPWAWTMVRLWRMSRGGMSGPGPLPDVGGTMDQSPYMIDCFAVMNQAEFEYKKETGHSENE